MDEAARRRAIDAALARLEETALRRPRPGLLGSGSAALDGALGGGYPRGHIIELFGPVSCGKTTIAMHAAAEAQRSGGTAAFIDSDCGLDAAYAHGIGVDVDKLLVVQPASAEEGLEIAIRLAASRAVDLIVVDSIAALAPRAELEMAAGALPGLHERIVTQALRKLAAAALRGEAGVVLTNQLRMRPGAPYGSLETTTGGPAVKVHASIRIQLLRTRVSRDGCRVRARIVKNRLGTAFREVEFGIAYGAGLVA